jgi:hypothetical protein
VAAKLLIDAVLLGWVKRLMDAYPALDFSEGERAEVGEIAAEDIEPEP